MEVIIDGELYRKVYCGDYNYVVNAKGDMYSMPFIDRRGRPRVQRKLKKSYTTQGYVQFGIQINGKQVRIMGHRAVAFAFIPNPENKPMINHKNGIKDDNRAENLEWCTRSENCIHSFAIGLQCNKGENHPQNKLTNQDVISIRNIYAKGGISTRKLAMVYNVSKTTIKDVINLKIWTHI